MKIISDIISNNPVRLRESYFINNYIEIYNEISLFSKDISDLPFKQKIWHWVNDKADYFTCKCKNRTTFNKNWKNGYRKYCSPKCAQSEISVKEKRKKTNLKKYGVDNVSKSAEIKKKQKTTNLLKYGFKSSFQNKEVKEKWRKGIIEKYGVDHYFKTEEFKIKAKKYYLERWGVEHPLSVDSIKDKIRSTCLKKYGVVTYLNTDECRNNVRNINISSHEKEIMSFIVDELGVECKGSDRSVIGPQLLDIYIPEYNLAIEFNGLYWHSELLKEKKYHLNKTLKCKEEGIQLIHIWEDDWLNRQEIIKSIIRNKLNKVNNKLNARSCEIRTVNNKETSEFLNKNHIQGYARFSKSLGLYYKNELVSLMCFGYRNINSKKEYELIRFCSKINYIVNGASSKLFNFFLNNNKEIDRIISYADVSIFNGGLYEKLKFKFEKRSDINYWWVVKGLRKHRFTYNKKKLVKMGYDKTMTEVEIMHSIGNYRIFGCGQDKYVWNRF